MDHLLPLLLYFICTLRLSLTRLAASVYNKYTAAAVAKLDPQNGAVPAVTWFWSRVWKTSIGQVLLKVSVEPC